MKFNKWTLGLAAVGVVSLASAAKAEEKASSVVTALSSTTISGYVDTSAQWNIGNDTEHFPPYSFGGKRKADGFNLNVVKLTIEKPIEEGEWAAGYKADLLFGPDAVGYNSFAGVNSDFGIKQAYVVLHAPVLGNGIDLKMGVFDTIIGYETFDSVSNPNFTRSYGYSIEPTEHTGLLASYKVNDNISFSAGIANTLVAGVNARNTSSQTKKAYMGSVALTAPDDFGFLSGSSWYAGAVVGFGGGGANGTNTANTANYYSGIVLKTPIAGLAVGLAWDYVDNSQSFAGGWGSVYGAYASYQATEKLSLHARGEFCDSVLVNNRGNYELTGTIQYDLWKNVISRLEARWDHANGNTFGGALATGSGDPTTIPPGTAATFRTHDAYVLLVNIIYKF